jgi:hypothetical protein
MEAVKRVKWIAVKSSVFTAAAYRSGARQLYLRFHDGDIYRYFDVPAEPLGVPQIPHFARTPD